MQTSVIPFSPLHLSEQGAPGHIGHCNWGTVWPKSSGKSGPFLERNDKLMGRTACSTLSNPPCLLPVDIDQISERRRCSSAAGFRRLRRKFTREPTATEKVSLPTCRQCRRNPDPKGNRRENRANIRRRKSIKAISHVRVSDIADNSALSHCLQGDFASRIALDSQPTSPTLSLVLRDLV